MTDDPEDKVKRILDELYGRAPLKHAGEPFEVKGEVGEAFEQLMQHPEWGIWYWIDDDDQLRSWKPGESK